MHSDSEEYQQTADTPWTQEQEWCSRAECWPFPILQQGGAQRQDHTGWNLMPCACVAGRTIALEDGHILTPKPVNRSPLGVKGTLQMEVRLLRWGDYPRLCEELWGN